MQQGMNSAIEGVHAPAADFYGPGPGADYSGTVEPEPPPGAAQIPMPPYEPQAGVPANSIGMPAIASMIPGGMSPKCLVMCGLAGAAVVVLTKGGLKAKRTTVLKGGAAGAGAGYLVRWLKPGIPKPIPLAAAAGVSWWLFGRK